MKTINSSSALNAAILELETRRATEEKALKADFQRAYESVQPINLIRNTFREVQESHDLTDNIVSIAAGLTSGYLSKKLFVGVSHNPFKKMLGTALMYGVTNLVANHPDTVKSVGNTVLNLIKSVPWNGERHTEDEETQENPDPN